MENVTLQWGQTSPVSDPPAVLIGKRFGDQERGDWKSRRPDGVWLTCTGRTGKDPAPGVHWQVKARQKQGNKRYLWRLHSQRGVCQPVEVASGSSW